MYGGEVTISYIFQTLNQFLSLKNLIVLFLIVLFSLVMVIVKSRAYNTRTLVLAALSIALSYLLSYIKIFHLPNGGAITLASMVPLIMLAYFTGPTIGILAGLCYGIFQLIQHPLILQYSQVFLDYPLAFSMLGIAGFFKRNLYIGAICAVSAKLFFHVVSGAMFFSSYLPKGQNQYLYSLIYNVSYTLPDLIICLLILHVIKSKDIIEKLRI